MLSISTVSAISVAALSVFGNLAQVGQWLGVSPASLKLNPPTVAERVEPALGIADRMTAFSPAAKQDHTGPSIQELIESMHQSCKAKGLNESAVECWVILGQWLQASSRYRDSLAAFDRAAAIDPRFGDPYFAKGGVYYDLALIGLASQRRYRLDPTSLTCEFQVDGTARALLELANAQFALGSERRLYRDVHPNGRYVITTWTVVTHRIGQIKSVMAGSPTITSSKVELLRVATWIPQLFPNDRERSAAALMLAKSFLAYALAHKDEFPELTLDAPPQ